MLLPKNVEFLLRPSASSRWLNCPGSAVFAATLPEETAGEPAIEGSAAHALAAVSLEVAAGILKTTPAGFLVPLEKSAGILISQAVPDRYWFDEEDPEESERIGAIEITEEMIGHVSAYVDYVMALVDEADPLGECPQSLYVETKVAMHGLPVEGTADAIVFGPNVIHVIDLKYGQGIEVKAVENTQAMIYLMGALDTLGPQVQPESRTIHIFQPRGRGECPKVWEPSIVDLTYARSDVMKAHKAIEEGEAQHVPGEHCHWCPGARPDVCPAIEYAIEFAAEADPLDTTTDKAADMLRCKWGVEEYFKACTAAVRSALENGQDVDGWKLVESYGNATWEDKEAAERYFARGGMKKIAFESLLLPPGRLKTAMKSAGHNPQLVDKRTHRPYKGLALVPESDKRDAAKKSTAQEDFHEQP